MTCSPQLSNTSGEISLNWPIRSRRRLRPGVGVLGSAGEASVVGSTAAVHRNRPPLPCSDLTRAPHGKTDDSRLTDWTNSARVLGVMAGECNKRSASGTAAALAANTLTTTHKGNEDRVDMGKVSPVPRLTVPKGRSERGDTCSATPGRRRDFDRELVLLRFDLERLAERERPHDGLVVRGQPRLDGDAVRPPRAIPATCSYPRACAGKTPVLLDVAGGDHAALRNE